MKFSTNQFIYDKDTNTFSQEASVLGIQPGSFPMGFVLVSVKTKMPVGMWQLEDNYIHDEFQSRIYEVVPHQQHIGTFKVEIFND